MNTLSQNLTCMRQDGAQRTSLWPKQRDKVVLLDVGRKSICKVDRPALPSRPISADEFNKAKPTDHQPPQNAKQHKTKRKRPSDNSGAIAKRQKNVALSEDRCHLPRAKPECKEAERSAELVWAPSKTAKAVQAAHRNALSTHRDDEDDELRSALAAVPELPAAATSPSSLDIDSPAGAHGRGIVCMQCGCHEPRSKYCARQWHKGEGAARCDDCVGAASSSDECDLPHRPSAELSFDPRGRAVEPSVPAKPPAALDGAAELTRRCAGLAERIDSLTASAAWDRQAFFFRWRFRVAEEYPG